MDITYIKRKLYTYDLYRHIGTGPQLYLCDALDKLEDDSTNVELLNVVAYSYYYLNNFYLALDYALSAYTQAKKQNATDELYYTSNLLGNIYRYLGIHISSIEYYMVALELSPSYHSQEKRCVILRHLAISYTEMSLLASALDYAIEALQLAQLIHHKQLLSDIQVTLCYIHLHYGSYEKALKLSTDSIELYKELNDQKGLIRAYLFAGELEYLTGNPNLAHMYYEKSLFIAKKIQYTYGLIKAKCALSRFFIEKGMYPNAKKMLEKALHLANHYTIQQPKISIYYALANLYEQEQHYQNAYKYYKLATSLKDNLNSFDYKESVYRLHQSYKKDRREELLRLYHEENKNLDALNKQLKKAIQLDPLTHLLNRRGLRQALKTSTFDNTHGLVICDIDHFKEINDTYGHQCGDFILIELAKVFKKICLPTFKISRWGGEEFLIIMPNTTMDATTKKAEEIHQYIEDYTYQYRQHRIQITLTFGVTSLRDTFEESIDRADRCLYLGKSNGRNQVINDTHPHMTILDPSNFSQYAT